LESHISLAALIQVSRPPNLR